MARASQRDKSRVRKDPPATMVDPNTQMLALVQADGTPLKSEECGQHDARFQYVWVDSRNESQYAAYQARGYMPCREGDGCARPVAKAYMADGASAKKGDLIERAGTVLMKRPIEHSHAEIAYSRQRSDDRLEAMGLLERELDRRARHNDMRISSGGYDG